MALTYNTGATGSRGRKVSDQYADMLRGFEELCAELEEIAKGADEPHRKAALEAGGKIIKDRAREIVQYGDEPYHLATKGIVIGQFTGNKIDIGWTEKGFYGRFLENGTERMDHPFPHINKAYEQVKTQVREAMLRELNLK